VSTFFLGFEILKMGANTSVTLSAAQIAAAFASGLTVLGTTGSFQGVFINNASNFSAASWNFSQWNPAAMTRSSSRAVRGATLSRVLPKMTSFRFEWQRCCQWWTWFG
jgi:hypothetical protein